jgi:hypothetical protein
VYHQEPPASSSLWLIDIDLYQLDQARTPQSRLQKLRWPRLGQNPNTVGTGTVFDITSSADSR